MGWDSCWSNKDKQFSPPPPFFFFFLVFFFWFWFLFLIPKISNFRDWYANILHWNFVHLPPPPPASDDATSARNAARPQPVPPATTGMLGRHIESCVHRVVLSQMIGWISNISYKRDGVDGFGQITFFFFFFFIFTYIYVETYTCRRSRITSLIQSQVSYHAYAQRQQQITHSLQSVASSLHQIASTLPPGTTVSQVCSGCLPILNQQTTK